VGGGGGGWCWVVGGAGWWVVLGGGWCWVVGDSCADDGLLNWNQKKESSRYGV
jgi:hypothetical protein